MEKITNILSKSKELLAIIIKADFYPEQSHFITEAEALQNVGYFIYPKGFNVKAHYHPNIERTIYGTPEVVIVKQGKLKLFIYDNEQNFVCKCIINENDTFLLISGGHSEEFIEPTTVFVVKQGPYYNTNDKIHFNPIL